MRSDAKHRPPSGAHDIKREAIKHGWIVEQVHDSRVHMDNPISGYSIDLWHSGTGSIHRANLVGPDSIMRRSLTARTKGKPAIIVNWIVRPGDWRTL